MTFAPLVDDIDVRYIRTWMQTPPDTDSVARFVPGPGIQKSLFVVNHHVTHLPADGSVYFTDTRAYHTALNGGETHRVHVVAALAYEQITA